MVRIRTDDIFITDGDKIVFGDDFDSELFWDDSAGDLRITTTISGVDPTENYHITTKNYDDTHLRGQSITSTAADNGQLIVWSGSRWELGDHGDLLGLGDDDHPYYVPRNGSRGFTSTVSGVDATEDYHLVTRGYLLEVLEGMASGVTVSGFNTVFGSDFNYVVDETESSTNSTTYQQKLRLNADATVSGSYRIGYTFEWRGSKSNTEVGIRVQIDDTETAFEFSSRPIVDVNTWRSITGFYYEPELNSGTHVIDADYRSANSGATAYIRKVRIEFWRVF